MVTNVYCNSVPFGADIAALWPRYFSMCLVRFIQTRILLTLFDTRHRSWPDFHYTYLSARSALANLVSFPLDRHIISCSPPRAGQTHKTFWHSWEATLSWWVPSSVVNGVTSSFVKETSEYSSYFTLNIARWIVFSHVPSIYNTAKESLYMYSRRGYNWRGFAAWGVSFCVIFPGLVAAYIPDKMSIGAQRIYSMVRFQCLYTLAT